MKNIVKKHLPTDNKPEENKKPDNALVVIRHGSTALNLGSERIRGWVDVPLAPEGIKEAEDGAKKLKGKGVDGIISSDLSRAHTTAKIYSKELGVPIIQVTSAFRPWNLGNMQGQPTKDVLPLLQYYIKDEPDTIIPGGESFNQFKKRFLAAVLEVQKKYPTQRIAVVTHHRGERLLQGWHDAGKPQNYHEIKPEVFMHKGIPPGAFTDFKIHPEK